MISAIVISSYDHDYLKECIASLAFVDEIIIAGKMDPSVLSKIKHKKSVRFIESEHHDFDVLLKKASSKASHKWIICLEANLYISDLLANEVTSE